MFRCLVFSLLFTTCFSSYEECIESSYMYLQINGRYCNYVVAGEKPVNWFEARDDCVRRGGHLADIQSDEENDIMMDLLNTYSHYTADNAPRVNAKVWLGRSLNNCGMWIWESGKVYDNWAHAQPELSGVLERPNYCVYMLASTSLWYTNHCGDSITNVWVCKFYRQ